MHSSCPAVLDGGSAKTTALHIVTENGRFVGFVPQDRYDLVRHLHYIRDSNGKANEGNSQVVADYTQVFLKALLALVLVLHRSSASSQHTLETTALLLLLHNHSDKAQTYHQVDSHQDMLAYTHNLNTAGAAGASGAVAAAVAAGKGVWPKKDHMLKQRSKNIIYKT